MTRIVLLAPDRAQLLQWQPRIEGFLAERLGLQLHPRRVLRPVGDGADFLGYVVRPHYRLVRRRVVGHLKERLALFQRRLLKGRVASGPLQIATGTACPRNDRPAACPRSDSPVVIASATKPRAQRGGKQSFSRAPRLLEIAAGAAHPRNDRSVVIASEAKQSDIASAPMPRAQRGGKQSFSRAPRLLEPLPARDMLPMSIEEQIICYAEKFFSKNGNGSSREKPVFEILDSLSPYGAYKVERFLVWVELFG